MKHRPSFLLLMVVLILCSSVKGWAQMPDQSNLMTIHGSVMYVSESGSRTEEKGTDVAYAVLAFASANKALEELTELFKVADVIGASKFDERYDAIAKKYEIIFNTNKLEFKVDDVLPGQILLFVNKDEGKVVKLTVVAGKTDYTDEVVFQSHLLDETIVHNEVKDPDISVTKTVETGDSIVKFEIRMRFPKGMGREDARMIVQPFAVTCSSGSPNDTIDYLEALVLEGERYHQLQIRRMGFDYYKNDKLARFYDPSQPLRVDSPVVIKKDIYYRKPDHLLSEKFAAFTAYSFEDFSHVYKEGATEGKCLIYNPFKFLDYSPALAEIPLTEEFFEMARSKPQEKNRKLDLRFERGTSRLTADPTNVETQRQIAQELSAILKTNNLVSITIRGAASPDGSASFNDKLARDRSEVARKMIAQQINMNPTIGSPYVYTWNDVCERLREQSKIRQAEAVQAIVDKGGEPVAMGNKISELSFYAADVEPILKDMRVMTCSYAFMKKFVMDEAECVKEYYRNKSAYINDELHFTNGDFYYLFTGITDSLEQDTLTMIAYREVTKEREYWYYNKIAPYVCNRMALLKMRQGTPDPEVLRPFINYSRKSNPKYKNTIDYEWNPNQFTKIRFNRHQILLNQAICYYMLEKPDTANFLFDWLKSENKGGTALEKLDLFKKMRKYYAKLSDLTAQEREEYQKGLKMALESNDNRAALYTEIPELGKLRVAMHYVNQMSDHNPRKWYLKALLWAKKVGDEPLIGKTGLPTGADAMALSSIPRYLAYMHHSFQLNPKLWRQYSAEWYVDEKLRKRFPYTRSQFAVYEQMFPSISREMDDDVLKNYKE